MFNGAAADYAQVLTLLHGMWQELCSLMIGCVFNVQGATQPAGDAALMQGRHWDKYRSVKGADYIGRLQAQHPAVVGEPCATTVQPLVQGGCRLLHQGLLALQAAHSLVTFSTYTHQAASLEHCHRPIDTNRAQKQLRHSTLVLATLETDPASLAAPYFSRCVALPATTSWGIVAAHCSSFQRSSVSAHV
jgi:hypothetical protein